MQLFLAEGSIFHLWLRADIDCPQVRADINRRVPLKFASIDAAAAKLSQAAQVATGLRSEVLLVLYARDAWGPWLTVVGPYWRATFCGPERPAPDDVQAIINSLE